MARVNVRIDDFEDGALPNIRASTGAPADRRYRVKAVHNPSWPLVLIFLGPIGWFVAIVVLTGSKRQVTGFVPFTDAVQERTARTRRAHWRRVIETGAISLVGVVGLALFDHPRPAAIVALIGLAVATVFAFAGTRPRGSVGLKLARNGRSVMMVNVSEVFAEQYRAQAARRHTERLDRIRSSADGSNRT